MAFKPVQFFPKLVRNGHIPGKTTEDLSYTLELERQKQEEAKIFSRERDTRIELNESIVELCVKNWPEEEIITFILRKFPEEKKDRIKKLIVHWKDTMKTVKNRIDKILSDVSSGLLNQKQSEERIKNLCTRYKFLTSWINEYYFENVSQVGDEQR